MVHRFFISPALFFDDEIPRPIDIRIIDASLKTIKINVLTLNVGNGYGKFSDTAEDCLAGLSFGGSRHPRGMSPIYWLPVITTEIKLKSAIVDPNSIESIIDALEKEGYLTEKFTLYKSVKASLAIALVVEATSRRYILVKHAIEMVSTPETLVSGIGASDYFHCTVLGTKIPTVHSGTYALYLQNAKWNIGHAKLKRGGEVKVKMAKPEISP